MFADGKNILGRLFAACAIIMILPLATVAGLGVTPASASPTGTIDASPCLNFHNGPNGADTQIGCIPDGTTIAIACTATGNSVSGPYGSTTLWDETTWDAQTGFVSDAWVYTGTASAVAGTCTSTPTPTTTTTQQPASASPTGTIDASPCLNFHNGPNGADTQIGCIPDGTTIAIACTATGNSVSGPYGSTTLWDETTWNAQTGFVSDAWVYTGTASAVAGTCTSTPTPTTVTTQPPASASPTGTIDASPCLNFHSGPNGADTQIGCIPDGTTIAIACTATGNSVSGPYGSTTLWDETTWNAQTGFVSDAWVYTGTASAVAGTCTSTPTPTTVTTTSPNSSSNSSGFLTTRLAILNDALSRPQGSVWPIGSFLGSQQGQCFAFVAKVLYDASSGKILLQNANALGYVAVYQQTSVRGSLLSGIAGGQPGDVIQISGNGYLHTMIIYQNLGGGAYEVVDQNFGASVVQHHRIVLNSYGSWGQWNRSDWPGSTSRIWQIGSGPG